VFILEMQKFEKGLNLEKINISNNANINFFGVKGLGLDNKQNKKHIRP
jgi:hypothetical protein